jgi:hypothetical protein
MWKVKSEIIIAGGISKSAIFGSLPEYISRKNPTSFDIWTPESGANIELFLNNTI